MMDLDLGGLKLLVAIRKAGARLVCWARGHDWYTEPARSSWSEERGLTLVRKASRSCLRCQAGESQDPWTGAWSPSKVVTWGYGPPEGL